jgi:hypothetical protein
MWAERIGLGFELPEALTGQPGLRVVEFKSAVSY